MYNKGKNVLSDIALIAAAGALAVSWFMRDDAEPASPPTDESRPNPHAGHVGRSLLEVETRLAALETKSAETLANLEVRLNEQSKKLSDLPSTQQIVAAMEQLLTRTTASLEQRLRAQAESIDVLKSAVATTDSLLERTLEFTKETLSQRSGA